MPTLPREVVRRAKLPHYIEEYGELPFEALRVFLYNLGSQEHNRRVYAALYWEEYEQQIEGWTEYLFSL